MPSTGPDVPSPSPLDVDRLSASITASYAERERLRDPAAVADVHATIAALDRGELRVATPPAADEGATAAEATAREWEVHAWVKQAILLYFGLQQLATTQVGPFEYHDKIPLKSGWAAAGVRVVPPATARFGAFIEAGAVLMPSYVNIGAWVGGGTMVDTWATVGSCAQIGRHVHLSGGVGVGGVLEPPGARPVIVEDGCFLGSRAIVVEGVHLEREVVLGANVVLTASTPILDMTGAEPVTYKGRVPARSVVIPGSRTKRFPAGDVQVAAAIIIGRRSASTDQRTSLNQALRDFDVPV